MVWELFAEYKREANLVKIFLVYYFTFNYRLLFEYRCIICMRKKKKMLHRKYCLFLNSVYRFFPPFSLALIFHYNRPNYSWHWREKNIVNLDQRVIFKLIAIFGSCLRAASKTLGYSLFFSPCEFTAVKFIVSAKIFTRWIFCFTLGEKLLTLLPMIEKDQAIRSTFGLL